MVFNCPLFATTHTLPGFCDFFVIVVGTIFYCLLSALVGRLTFFPLKYLSFCACALSFFNVSPGGG